MSAVAFDTVLINGSVGTGKTTTAEGLENVLKQRDIPGAVIDVDWLRRSWPSPPGDPFRSALGLENLRAVAANFRRAGARVLVVATVVETGDELKRCAVALDSQRLLHVRLTAEPDVVLARLTKRHEGDDEVLRWHSQRHPELARILDRAGFTGELLVDTTHKATDDVVQEIVSTLVG